MNLTLRTALHPDQLGASPLRYEYDLHANSVVRTTVRIDGTESRSAFKLDGSIPQVDAHSAFDYCWLTTKELPPNHLEARTCRIADLFCGCGGLSLGVAEACRALGMNFEVAFASDFDAAALDVYEKNFRPILSSSKDISDVVNGALGAAPTAAELQLLGQVGKIDLVIGGPPCQGHSDLNNHTRREDPRNTLILRLVRFVELFSPKAVIIENVQGTAHDKTGSVSMAIAKLKQLGYNVEKGLITASDVGVAQVRRRFFVIASRNHTASFSEMRETHGTPTRPFSWACGDLVDVNGGIFDSAAEHSLTNKQRIDYLHDHDLYELPNHQRPDCHRLKAHGYTSVYGRMWWTKPSPTITTGFGSTGQGRFVHPTRRRTITPHEAARLQFFPDFFRFPETGRRNLQKLIGNAVPPKLGFVVSFDLLRKFLL